MSVQPTGDGPHATVTKMLRLLGIVVLVAFVVNLLNNVLTLTMGADYYDGPAAGIAAAGALGGIILGVVFTGLVLFWITYTIGLWANRDPRANTHVLVIAILATVFGVLIALGLFSALAATAYPTYMAINLLLGLVGAAEAYCGIMILANRSKATTGTGNPGMGSAN